MTSTSTSPRRQLLVLGGLILISAFPGFAADLKPEQIAQDVLSSMDQTVDPCQDFYQYSCGGWLKNTVRPADRVRWVRSFSTIDDRNNNLIRTILEESAKNPGDDVDRRMVGDFYGSCMDEAAIEKAGAAPLKPELEAISAIKTVDDLFRITGVMHQAGHDPFFGIGVLPDFKNPGIDILFAGQGGLGLPDRDYYTSADPKKKAILAAYEKHIATMLGLIGDSPKSAAKQAQTIVAFETELAKVSRTRAEMRDVDKLYNKIDFVGLVRHNPTLPWAIFLKAGGIEPHDNLPLNVATPEFFTRFEELVKVTPLETMRSYLRWNVARNGAPALSRAFVDARFNFFNKELLGQQENQPRWKRCVAATEGALGFAIGKIYVKDNFAGDSKKKADEMIDDVEAAFISSLENLAWMDDATRWRAWQKTQALGNKIGYPEVWRDTSKMDVGRKSYYANIQAATTFETLRQIKKVGQPVDRTEWGMAPQAVNAYYNPLQNEIAFPAGILQPPFFHKDFPPAMNYGSIGVVVGHELTHGFDDKGRKFAPNGELREWWEPAVSERFEKQADCIRQQYGNYEVVPGVKQDGSLTAGENIADIGGLKQSWMAYQMWKERHDAEAPTVPGLADDQLFFVAFAQTWCSLSTEEADRVRATTDSHSHPRFRAIGAVVNHPNFGATFSCPLGTPMNPVDKCVLW